MWKGGKVGRFKGGAMSEGILSYFYTFTPSHGVGAAYAIASRKCLRHIAT
jgi:hypothetical protein